MLIRLLALIASIGVLHAQTVGVLTHDPSRTQPGYTLFSPTFTTTTYLIDTDGQLVHTWPSQYKSGLATMLLDDGAILRAGKLATTGPIINGAVGGGVIEIINWDGSVRWTYRPSPLVGTTHHDVEVMPNGNVLLMAWYSISIDSAKKLGRRDTTQRDTSLWFERIIEVRPVGTDSGEVVWEWDAREHVIQDVDPLAANYGVLSEHPELLNINAGTSYPDWLHLNSVRYHAERDEVMLSVHGINEIIVIKRSTGDIVYRWGNPKNYGRGTIADQKLFGQHDGRWIPRGTPGEGNITIFNNGVRRPGGTYSSLEEIVPPLDASGAYVLDGTRPFGPDSLAWRYAAPPGERFVAQIVSGWTRQPNGNALACLGDQGVFVEVTRDSTVVWKYVSPVGKDRVATQGQLPLGTSVFKIDRYPANHPAFVGKDLTPRGTLESIALDVREGLQGGTVTIDHLPGMTHAIIRSDRTTNMQLNAYDVLGRWLGVVYTGELTPGAMRVEVPRGTMYLRRSEE
jgi:hypothetical protein